MGPKPDNLDHFLILIHLIDQAMLNIDPSGINAGQIPHQFFIKRLLLYAMSGSSYHFHHPIFSR